MTRLGINPQTTVAFLIALLVWTGVGVGCSPSTTENAGTKTVEDSGTEALEVAESPETEALATTGTEAANQAVTTPPPHPDSEWATVSNTDPMTDEKVTVAILSPKLITGTPDWRRDSVSMVVRCAQNTTVAYINWNNFVNNERHEVTYRIGDDAPVSRRWDVSTDYKSTFLPNPVSLLKQLIEVKPDSFIVRTRPHSEGYHTLTFDMSQIETGLAEVRQDCNW